MSVYLSTVEQTLKAHAKIREVYSGYLSAIFKEECFSPNEINILIFLYNNPSINTSKELTMMLGVSKGLISRSVETLAERGLLIKTLDENDRRNYHLSLSPKTKPLILKMQASKDEFSRTLLKDINQDEWQTYQKVLAKINENIENVIEGVKKYENKR